MRRWLYQVLSSKFVEERFELLCGLIDQRLDPLERAILPEPEDLDVAFAVLDHTDPIKKYSATPLHSAERSAKLLN